MRHATLTVVATLMSAFLCSTALADANLVVEKAGSPDPVPAGQNLVYAITVTNLGLQTATSVNLTDVIPDGTTFVSLTISPAPNAWTISTPSPGGTGTVTATTPALSVATPVFFTLVVNVNLNTTGTVTNTATTTAAENDPFPANNSATTSTTVIAPVQNADLSIAKTAGAGPFVAGGAVDFSIVVTNNGPGPATNVTVTDTFSGAVLDVTSSSQGVCTGLGPVTCFAGTIAAGGTATMTLLLRASETPGVVTNTATVSASEPDPNPADNVANANTVTISPLPPIPALSPLMLIGLAVVMCLCAVTLLRGG